MANSLKRWLDGATSSSDFFASGLPMDMQKKIASARVIVLGEMNHFIHEKCDFRLAWLELLQRDFTLVLAEELGRSDGYRVNRFLASGDESWLDRVPTFGFKEDARVDRDDSKKGILKASSDHYPTALFFAEQRRFYKGVRSLGIRLHGFDVNGSTTAGYLDIRERLALVSSKPWYTDVHEQLEPVEGESVTDEIERIARLRSFVGALETDDPELIEISRDLRVMQASLEFFVDTNGVDDYQGLGPALGAREELMKEQVHWLLDDLQPDEKLVLCGHALHLVKHDEHAVVTGPGGGVTSSLGHHLARELEVPVFAVWMIYGSGKDSQPFPDLPNRVNYPRGTLNKTLMPHGECVLRTDSAGMVGKAVSVGHMYNSVIDLILADQVDVIHFYPSVNPLRDA